MVVYNYFTLHIMGLRNNTRTLLSCYIPIVWFKFIFISVMFPCDTTWHNTMDFFWKSTSYYMKNFECLKLPARMFFYKVSWLKEHQMRSILFKLFNIFLKYNKSYRQTYFLSQFSIYVQLSDDLWHFLAIAIHNLIKKFKNLFLKSRPPTENKSCSSLCHRMNY